MEKKYLVTKNTIYNFLGQIILLILGFIITPFIIHSLGNESYGILSVVMAMVGYFSVLDLGLGISVIKFVADFSAKADRQSLEKVIGTALVAYIMVGLLGSFLLILTAKLLVNQFFHIPSWLIPTALVVFYVSALGFLINMILAVFHAVPSALQRMDIVSSRNIFFGLLNTVGIIILLSLGYGLVAVVIWNTLVSALATLIFLAVILRLLPGISIKPKFDWEIFSRLIKFGGFKFLSNIAGQVVFQLDKILIGIFHPISAVTFYAAPVSIVQKGLMLMLNITNAAFPALSQSHTLNDYQRIKDLYLRMYKFIGLVIFPIMAFLFVFSDQLILIWLGKEFVSQSAPVLKILALAYLIAAISAPGVVAADAFGKPQVPAFFATISAVINLLVALILIPKFGVIGAAWAMVINFASQVPIFLIFVHKKIVKISNLEVIRLSLLKPLIAGIVTAVFLSMLTGLIDQPLVSLLAGSLLFGLSFLIINLILGTFDARDKLAINYFINKVSAMIKGVH